MVKRYLCLLPEFLAFLLVSCISGDMDYRACAFWCPPNPPCFNAKACGCIPEFHSKAKYFSGPLENCDDNNNCASSSPTVCGIRISCQDTEEETSCWCRKRPKHVSEAVHKNKSLELCDGVFLMLQLTLLSAAENAKVNGTQSQDSAKTTKEPPTTTAPKSRRSNGPSASPDGMRRLHSDSLLPSWFFPQEVNSGSRGPPSHGGYWSGSGFFWGWYSGASFPAWDPPPGVKSQRLTNFFDRVEDQRRSFKTSEVQGTIQTLLQDVDDLLGTPEDLTTLATSQLNSVVSNLLDGLVTVLRGLSRGIINGTLTLNSTSGTKLSLEVMEPGCANVTLSHSQASMLLDCALVPESNSSGPFVAGLVSTPGMDKLMTKAPLVLEPEEEKVLQETHRGLKRKVSPDPITDVISAFIESNDTQNLSIPATIFFSHHPVTPGPRQELFCGLWEHGKDGSGHWATRGCKMVSTKRNSTTCRCSRLSSFAVLMAHYYRESQTQSQDQEEIHEDPGLVVITYMGLGLSLLCLLLAILTFLLCRAIQNTSTCLHLQLSICLFLAHLLFLTAIDRTEIPVLCAITAGVLHYLYLASFTWMLLEGLNLFLTARNLMVVNYSSVTKFIKKFMFPVGYGVPAVIVVISAASRPHLYGTPDRCWLDTQEGFIWTFLGPICIIFSINLIFFLLTFWIVRSKLSSLNNEVSTLQNTRMLTFKATAQLFILGCTWFLGLLQVGPAAKVMAYLFTIINSLQGVFIFLIYCLLSQQVREQYRKWFQGVKRTIVESEKYTLSSREISEVPKSSMEPSEESKF